MSVIYPSAASTRKFESNRLYDIPFLDDQGSNFQNWKHRNETILDLRGLMPIVDGSEPRPNPNTASAISVSDWDARDKEAKAQISLTLKDEPYNGVMYATSAKDTWDRLHRRYEGKGQQTIAYLISDLFRSTLSDEQPLEPQLNTMLQRARNTRSEHCQTWRMSNGVTYVASVCSEK